MPITANTTGREHIILIAVPGEAAPSNFVFIAQPSLELAKREMNQHRGGGAVSPFEHFFQFAAFRSGSTRGVDTTPGTKPIVMARSWIVEPAK